MSKFVASTLDLSERLGKIKVLVVDRDARTASLVTSVLRAFGFTHIEVATNAEEVIEAMRHKPFELIITEWHLAKESGVQLVRAVRSTAQNRIMRRDVPIIMLTARSDLEAVRQARDSGITEFLAKPFSAKTLAQRLIQVIDNPRIFIDAPGYVGPCRRRRGDPPPEEEERRGRDFDTLPANRELAELIGTELKAAELFTEQLVAEAQEQLQNQEAVFIEWANDDIHELERAYTLLSGDWTDMQARERMMNAAYVIKSQAGIFGYDLGTQVAGSLVDYLENHPRLNRDHLTVLRKHIDTMAVIFHQKIKQAERSVGTELLESLQKLVAKLG